MPQYFMCPPMTQPFLSIAIPTWNRHIHLKENIEQLLREIAKVPELAIEIFVSDNASTDETQAYCESMQQQYEFFCYHRSDTNLGANANFQNVIALSHGEYIWLLGDDDLIHENCLHAIAQDIQQHQHPDIIIGGCINDQTQRRLYPPFVEQTLLTDHTLLQQYDAIKLAGKISTLIFKRTSITPWLNTARKIIRDLKTPWPHLIWFILILNNHGKLLCLPYCTNYFLEKNRYNMLQDGISRTNIMIDEYARLIQHIYRDNTLNQDFYKILIRSVHHGRYTEFLKIVAYTTYMNSYVKTVSNAWRVLHNLPGFKNKLYFTLSYFIPVLLPQFIRKALLYLPRKILPNRQAHQAFIVYLKKSQAILLQKEQAKRHVFNKEGL